MDHDLPRQAIRDHWEAVEADLEATARELREAGWRTVTLHTGDATTLPGGEGRQVGLDLLVPDDEFEALVDELDDGASFAETEVYRRTAGGVAFLVCVFRDPDREVAVVVAAFYPQLGRDATTLAEHAIDAGQLPVHVRPLDRDRVVTFTIDDPSLVFPDDWA